MGKETAIEWTDSTWNPVQGCVKVSPGCEHCYAERFARRKLHGQDWKPWTYPNTQFNVGTCSEQLPVPFRWYEPRKVFTCSMSDLFQEGVEDDYIEEVFGVMMTAHWHTFQVLTKRPERMAEFFAGSYAGVRREIDSWRAYVAGSAFRCKDKVSTGGVAWPPPNIWWGTSVEDQKRANERIPFLMRIPAKVLFVSIEPMLEPIDLKEATHGYLSFLKWVIVGGESGPGARPMRPDWVRKVRDDCRAAGVPFFFKQWGEFCPYGQLSTPLTTAMDERSEDYPVKVGKKVAGALLDGQNWYQFPL